MVEMDSTSVLFLLLPLEFLPVSSGFSKRIYRFGQLTRAAGLAGMERAFGADAKPSNQSVSSSSPTLVLR